MKQRLAYDVISNIFPESDNLDERLEYIKKSMNSINSFQVVCAVFSIRPEDIFINKTRIDDVIYYISSANNIPIEQAKDIYSTGTESISTIIDYALTHNVSDISGEINYSKIVDMVIYNFKPYPSLLNDSHKYISVMMKLSRVYSLYQQNLYIDQTTQALNNKSIKVEQSESISVNVNSKLLSSNAKLVIHLSINGLSSYQIERTLIDRKLVSSHEEWISLLEEIYMSNKNNEINEYYNSSSGTRYTKDPNFELFVKKIKEIGIERNRIVTLEEIINTVYKIYVSDGSINIGLSKDSYNQLTTVLKKFKILLSDELLIEFLFNQGDITIAIYRKTLANALTKVIKYIGISQNDVNVVQTSSIHDLLKFTTEEIKSKQEGTRIRIPFSIYDVREELRQLLVSTDWIKRFPHTKTLSHSSIEFINEFLFGEHEKPLYVVSKEFGLSAQQTNRMLRRLLLVVKSYELSKQVVLSNRSESKYITNIRKIIEYFRDINESEYILSAILSLAQQKYLQQIFKFLRERKQIGTYDKDGTYIEPVSKHIIQVILNKIEINKNDTVPLNVYNFLVYASRLSKNTEIDINRALKYIHNQSMYIRRRRIPESISYEGKITIRPIDFASIAFRNAMRNLGLSPFETGGFNFWLHALSDSGIVGTYGYNPLSNVENRMDNVKEFLQITLKRYTETFPHSRGMRLKKYLNTLRIKVGLHQLNKSNSDVSITEFIETITNRKINAVEAYVAICIATKTNQN